MSVCLSPTCSASKKTQLHSDAEEYATGDRISIQARLYNNELAPLTVSSVKGIITRKDSGTQMPTAVTLRQLPSQDGTYQVEFTAPAPGTYGFHVDTDPDTTLDFSVVEPNQEQDQTSMNEPLLRSMAQASGGGFFREEDLHTLPAQIHHTTQPVLTTTEDELAFSPLYFLILLSVISAEWIIRKLVQLK